MGFWLFVELFLERLFLLLSVVIVEWFAVLVSVVFVLSEIGSLPFWWCSGIVDVAHWWPTNVTFDSHAVMQFSHFVVKNVFPSNILFGQHLVLFLVVEMSHLLDSFSD